MIDDVEVATVHCAGEMDELADGADQHLGVVGLALGEEVADADVDAWAGWMG